jgi:hypothetical protein
MHEYHNPHTGERYVVRNVPLAEAVALRAAGAKFYDNTKLVAVNTCPTWGILRYEKHKTEASIGGRNLALECGQACHDFFAAIRMWSLLRRTDLLNSHIALLDQHGLKLVGGDRWASMKEQPQDAEPVNNAINFALDALHTSGYYDDPSDRKRTMANMEVACITYAHRYFQSDLPVYVKDDFIGVEVPFVVEIKRQVQVGYKRVGWGQTDIDVDVREETYYYCGRIDGVHTYGGSVTAGENKTASRPDGVWRSSFHMSSQVTGYNVALSAILGVDISDALIMGLQIPVPTRDIYSGVAFEPVRRTTDDKLRWFEWFFHSVGIYEKFPDPTTAPRYTHSCNRYFSICQFLPFCTMTREEQREMLDGMRVDEWSPLDHIVEAKEPVGEV